MLTCQKCGNHFPHWTVVDGKRRNLSSRKFCLDCSPFGQHNTQDLSKPALRMPGKKVCTRCGFALDIATDFYKKPGGKPHAYCKRCYNVKTVERQNKLKAAAVIYLGGRCLICGYSKYSGALDFHHLDPFQKDVTIGAFRGRSLARIKNEWDKCILVCVNCHREIHAGLTRVP